MSIYTRSGYREVTPNQLREALRKPCDANLLVEGIGPLEKRGEALNGRMLIAHGAGAGQDSTFMRLLRQALSENGVQTLAIEFAYMQRMREENRRRPPPRIAGLIEEMARWCDMVSRVEAVSIWLGGKSLGGRVASMLAARDGAVGLALCGYPFHPPGKPDTTRLAHWPAINSPTLVVQGTRDPFGKRDEVEGYALPANVSVKFLEDGDHDWKPRRISGRDQADLIAEGAAGIAALMAASR